MFKKLLMALGGLLGLAAVVFFGFLPGYVESSRNSVVPHDPFPVTPEAAALHATLTIGDWHADSLLWNRDLTKQSDRGQVDLPRLITGNVAVQVFTAVTKSPAGQNYAENSADSFDNITPLVIGQMWPPRTWNSLYERAAYQAQRLHGFQADAPEILTIIKTGDDLTAHLAARAAGSTAVAGLLGLEGGHPFEGDIAKMDGLWDEGYRLIGLHHFFDNELGGSLHGHGESGLSDFGRAVVAKAVTDGWIIDLAHSSEAVARDVVAMTDAPLVVSHGGLHGHCPVQRNYPDPLMQMIVASGGVVGMGYWADVTCGGVAPADVAEMIVLAVETLGEDHVSLGSDYDGSVETGFDTSELAALTSALLDAGLTETQIRKVMGDNLIRVMRARLP